MREIKFRAWHKKRKKFYEVLHLHLKNYMNESDWATVKGYDIIHQTDVHIQLQPKDCIILQYTGLKDCDGTDIYEGDIVDCESFIVPIQWSTYGHAFFTIGTPPREDRLTVGHAKHLEVIGNIYENPELLEGE